MNNNHQSLSNFLLTRIARRSSQVGQIRRPRTTSFAQTRAANAAMNGFGPEIFRHIAAFEARTPDRVSTN